MKAPLWLEYFSIAQHIRRSKGHRLQGFSLLLSCWRWCAGRERLQRRLHPLPVTPRCCLASTAAQRSSKGILHCGLPTPCPQAVSSWSTADLALGLLSNPCAPAPTSECSRGLVSLSGVYRAVARFVCVVLTPFRLPQMSCCTLQWLKCLPSIPNVCPNVGISPPLQFPHPMVAGPVLLTLFFFPSFLHPTELFMNLYIPFQWSGTLVCSQLVFCKIF